MLGKSSFGLLPPSFANSLRSIWRMKSFSLIQTGIADKKALQPPRGEAVIGLEQPLELEVGLVVKGDRGEVGELQAGFVQDIGDRMAREGGILLLAGKPLLVGGRDDFPVHDQGGGAVVVKGGDAENCFRHWPSLRRPRR